METENGTATSLTESAGCPVTGALDGPGGLTVPVHNLSLGFDRILAVDTRATAAQFEQVGYLALPGLLTPAALEDLRQEAVRLQARAKRRDFRMESMGGTPRHMTTLGGIEIAETAPRISALYRDPRMLATLGSLVGLNLELAADPVERHVLNILHRSGDTHGLHTDDYPLALVMFLESPSCEAGCGHLEFFDACEAGRSSIKTHSAGDAYLLRADMFPHRVRPIHDGCVRTVLNFAYGAESLPVVETGTASILYS